jgi:hypothetical protein
VPLIAKYCDASKILDDAKGGEEQPFTVTSCAVGFTQDRFMTQPPNVLLRSPEKIDTQESGESFNLGFDTQGFTIEAADDEIIDASVESQPTKVVINVASESRPTKVIINVAAESQPTTAVLPPASPKALPKRLVEFLKSLTVVPALAFRSILCTNDDELAKILEGKQTAVAAFLARATQIDANIRPEEEQTTKRCKLLDRHDSAERITWSSLISSPIKSTTSIPKKKWHKADEKRLIDGYERFGRDWELIRLHCNLDKRTDVSLRDKVQQLINTGQIAQ